MAGRLTADGRAINGRYGYDTNVNATLKSQAATAGTNYLYRNNSEFRAGHVRRGGTLENKLRQVWLA